MNTRPNVKRRKPMADINVVPYIDVMLVLLVIFMITAPLLKSGVDVKLPQASAKAIEDKPTKPLILTVSNKGDYYLNISDKPEEPLEAKHLVALVNAALHREPERSVLVRGDERVDYGKVVRAMALLQSAGVPEVGLLTEQPQTN